MLLTIIRAVFILIIAALANRFSQEVDASVNPWFVFVGILVLAVAFVIADILIPRKRVQLVSAIYFGLVVGLILANLLATAFTPMMESMRLSPLLAQAILGMLTVVVCYTCISVLLQTKDDFRFIIPYMEFAREVKGARPLILDTSVVIDGRIADVAETRVIDQPLVVPRFVLQELQGIADSSEKLRRNRGRRGLDILSRLQKLDHVEVRIHEEEPPEAQGVKEVDQRLVLLAKSLGGKVVTNDYNLNKIAKLQGVEVINLNDLANALKPIVLPGEGLSVRVIRRGEEPGQGVGYLDDGTMVVVEQGAGRQGETVKVVVTSVLQTTAGRMIFGKIDGGPGPNPGPNRGNPSAQAPNHAQPPETRP